MSTNPTTYPRPRLYSILGPLRQHRDIRIALTLPDTQRQTYSQIPTGRYYGTSPG
jgi:hypothetical protein